MACHLAAVRTAAPRCVDCGAAMKPGRERCQACWRALRRAEGGPGSGGKNKVDTCACGQPKLARSPKCRACTYAAMRKPAPIVDLTPAPRLVITSKRAPKPLAPKKSTSLLVERLAARLQRDPRPDEEKINDRLELIKAIERRVTARRQRERRSA